MKTSLQISAIAASLAVASSLNAQLIEFTSPDYSDGALNGQQSFVAEAGWNVADAAGTGNAITTNNAEIAVWNAPITLGSGESFSYTMNFQFGGTFAAPTSFTYIMTSGLSASNAATSVGVANTNADSNIQIFSGSDQYRLLKDFGTIPGISSPTGFNTDDVFQYDYTLTLGADAANTFYTVELTNITDGMGTGVGTVTGVDQGIYDALTGAGAFVYFQSIGMSNNASGITSMQVNSITVPEPSTYAMVAGVAVLGIAFLRRRRA
ncbi:MAG: PEP-CTERM sorting domain-containing protein [Verrucomicrobiota bacterium]